MHADARLASWSYEEIRARARATETATVDLVTLTAHNLDSIYVVDRVAADHEVRIGTALRVSRRLRR